MFYNYSQIGLESLLFFGAFVFIGIYGYTSLMDGAHYAIWIEILRSLAGIVFIAVNGDWFGINTYFQLGSYLILIYFVLTLVGTIYFAYYRNDILQNGIPI